MYDNELYKERMLKFKPRMKLNHKICMQCTFLSLFSSHVSFFGVFIEG